MRRVWALPLVPLWWTGARVKNLAYDAGWRKGKRLDWPVVSVGSLSAGGAGKTPVVKMLAELFASHGVEVDVLSRGYGRGSGVVERVGAGGNAVRFGDEPLEMARAGLRVYVGAVRLAAGRLAEADFAESPTSEARETEQAGSVGGRRVHLLDDGFQHRRLWRAADVALLTLADAQDWLLPAGNLREGTGSLGRAGAVVVREEEAEALRDLLAARTRAAVWVVRRELRLPAEAPRRPIAFCGIARPDGFFAMLGGAGCEMLGQVAFADHHGYGREDFERLVAAGIDREADGFVTTAKDAVKISDADRALLGRVGPVAVAELRVALVEPERAWQQMCGMLGWEAGLNGF